MSQSKDDESTEDKFTRWFILASGEGAGRVASLYFTKMKNEAISNRILLMNSNRTDIINTLMDLEKQATSDAERNLINQIRQKNTLLFGGGGAGVYIVGEDYARKDYQTKIRRPIEGLGTGGADVVLDIAALGGGTGNGSIPYIINQMKYGTSVSLQNHIHIALAILPYSFEPQQMHFNTICGLSRLLKYDEKNQQNADMVLIVDNSKIADDIKKNEGLEPKYIDINYKIIKAIDLMIAAGRRSKSGINIQSYVNFPKLMNLYHFTPCVSVDNDINLVGLEKALYKAANNSYVKMNPKTAIIAYLIVNLPEKFLNKGEFTEEGINKIFNKWKKDNITGNSGMVSLAYAKTEKETFDVMLLLGGFDLRPTIEKYWQEYKSLKKTLIMASEGGHTVNFGDNIFSVKEIERIEENLNNYINHTEEVLKEKSRELKEQQKITSSIEILRGYVHLQDNNIRFGIRVINNSEFTISDVEVLLHYDESLFDVENKIQKLGTIPPTVPRTAEFVLKPRGCIHKEELGSTILYKDHHYKKYLLEMRPKEVHCVHPFLKEKAITQTEFLALSKSGYSAEVGVNFENIDAKLMSTFFIQTYRKKLYKVSEYTINNETILYLSGESIGDKTYYLLTAVIKEYEGLTQIMLKANSDKPHGLNSLLNDEILENLRHLVKTVQSAREIGIIKKEQVINIINSVVQRTSFSGGEGATSININESVVQRTILKGEEEKH